MQHTGQNSAVLPVRIALAEAELIVQRAWRGSMVCHDRTLTYFPLLGVVFELHTSGRFAGPAKLFRGQQYHVVVDRCSATPLLTHWDSRELLPNIPTLNKTEVAEVYQTLPEQLQLRVTKQASINIARRALVTQLLRKFKLASQFELQCIEVIWPLWKPNWLLQTSSGRALVDALNGNVVFQR